MQYCRKIISIRVVDYLTFASFLVLLLITLLLILQGCSSAAKDTVNKTAGPPSVTVNLTDDLQKTIGLESGQLQLVLILDEGTPQAIPLNNLQLNLPDLSEGSHTFAVRAFYALTINSNAPVLLGEVFKTSTEKTVVVNSDEWIVAPYDRNNDGRVDLEDTKAFDEDEDGMLNLAEVLVGGNPFNPAPTFINSDSIRIPEPQTDVLILEAISPRPNATVSYSLNGGADQVLFTLNGNSLTFTNPPAFDPNGINDYQVQIAADDGTRSTTQLITVSVTDEFNLTVTVGFKQLNFTWAALANASYYKLLENPDGQSGFGEILGSGNLTELNYIHEIAVHLFNRANAQYMLEAYDVNNVRLKTSIVLNITDPLLDAIGYFKASNTDADDSFGSHVSLSADGNTLAVGAQKEDSVAIGVNDATVSGGDNSAINSGAVYIYTRISNTSLWNPLDYIKASNTESGDNFGSSVSLSADGSTLAVGAHNEDSAATGINDTLVGSGDNTAENAGAVYVYTRANNTSIWGSPDYIKASNTGALDYFGVSVSLSADGNTLVVGAIGESSAATGVNNTTVSSGDNSAPFSGAVYVYTRASNTNLWTETDYIKASNTEGADAFGSVSLSADGNTLAVGAFGEDSAATGVNDSTVGGGDNSALGSGAVYVYTRASNTSLWTTLDYVKASNSEADDLFGVQVSLSADGNTLAVGARDEDSASIEVNDTAVGGADNSSEGAGAVYVYTRISNINSWGPPDYIKASNTEASILGRFGDQFGSSVSLSADGNTLSVGAHFEYSVATGVNDGTVGSSDNSATWAGAVYIYSRTSNISTWRSLPEYIKASNTESGDRFGSSVSLSADGNTLAVGANGEKSAATGINDSLLGSGDNSATDAGAVYVY